MEQFAEIQPCFDPQEVDTFIHKSASCAEQTRAEIRVLGSALTETKDRIEQSEQRIAASDLLINDLSVLLASPR